MENENTGKTNIRQLFEDLPVSIRQLAEQIQINEVTLARIRDGKPTSRPTANKLLMYFSDLYEQKYNLRNVEGINIPEVKRGKKAVTEQEEKPALVA